MQLDVRKCFGAQPQTGNPALVVRDGPPSVAERQAMAAERALPACVFLTRLDEALFEADYYYPNTRSPLCLHATLAAAQVLAQQTGPVQLVTAMQRQPVQLLHDEDLVFAGVQRQPVPDVAIDPELAAWLLDQPGLRPVTRPVLASVGSPKLLIQVADAATLHQLTPDLARILAWGRQAGVNGCYVYCQVGQGAFEGRNFNHADPDREDRATGVAAGALCAHLGIPLTLFQGKSSSDNCKMTTRMHDATIYVGGQVTR